MRLLLLSSFLPFFCSRSCQGIEQQDLSSSLALRNEHDDKALSSSFEMTPQTNDAAATTTLRGGIRQLQTLNDTLLDLYIRSRHVQTADSTLPCTTCDDSIPSCFTNKTLFVENECYRFPGERSRTFQGDADRVCRTDHENLECDTSVAPSFECVNEWPTNQCGANFEEMERFVDWCIQEDAPRDEYVIPLVKIRLHETAVLCQANIQALDVLVPDDNMLCNHAGVKLANGTTIRGGSISYCDGDVLRIKYFSDENCTQQEYGVADLSRTHLDECSDQPTGFFSQGSCASPPAYYCKSFYNSFFFSQVAPEYVPAPSPPEPKPAADLYIRKSNYLFTNVTGTTEFSECPNGCDDAGYCFQDRLFDIQAQCSRWGPSESRIYQGDVSTICRINYVDEQCTALGRSCAQLHAVDECVDSSVLNRFEDWCIEESEPRDEYVVPMVRATKYDDMASCQANVNAYESWAFADRSFCQSGSVDINGVRQGGSFYSYCDGSTLRTNLFSDDGCAEQVDGMDATEVLTGTECSAHSDGSAWTATCNSPSFYCKDLYSAGFGFQITNIDVGTPMDTPIPTMAPEMISQGDSPTNPPVKEIEEDSATAPTADASSVSRKVVTAMSVIIGSIFLIYSQ